MYLAVEFVIFSIANFGRIVAVVTLAVIRDE
jgi:hypothetical protein